MKITKMDLSLQRIIDGGNNRSQELEAIARWIEDATKTARVNPEELIRANVRLLALIVLDGELNGQSEKSNTTT